MRNPTMVYKAPGPHAIHGAFFDYKIIDADDEAEVEAAQAEGWFFTTPEAYEAEKAAREAKLAAEQFASDGTQGAQTASKGRKQAATPPSANVGTQAPAAPTAAPGNGNMSAAGGWAAAQPVAQ